MKKIISLIQNNPLFSGIEPHELEVMLDCLEANAQAYQKEEALFLEGYAVSKVGIVVQGRVQVSKNDAQGKVSLLAELGPNQLFGEVFACAGIDHSPVTVVASEPCQVLWLNYRKIVTTCRSACAFHSKLIENMLKIIAQKNLMLNQKINILSKRTIRERVLLFLQEQGQGRKSVTIPFNREEMAAFLCVDRSAMSAELSKMQQEGLLTYHKNRFELLE